MSEPVLVDSGSALAGAGLIHSVLRPQGAGPYPTAVLIHGRGGDENVMWLFARSLPADPNWLIVSPRGILSDAEGGYVWHPDTTDQWPAVPAFEEAAGSLARFVLSLPALYQADAGRIYLMGFSQGAATVLSLAVLHRGLAQAIAALMGFLPKDAEGAVEARALAGLPIFMAAGRRDPRIPLEVSRDSASRLRAAGARLDYREYDTAHKMNAEAMRDLAAWWQALG